MSNFSRKLTRGASYLKFPNFKRDWACDPFKKKNIKNAVIRILTKECIRFINPALRIIFDRKHTTLFTVRA